MTRLISRALGKLRKTSEVGSVKVKSAVDPVATLASRYRVSSHNVDEVYLRTRILLDDPRVPEERKGYIRSVSSHIDSMYISMKHDDMRAANNGLQSANSSWLAVGRDFDMYIFPDLYLDIQSTSIRYVKGLSIDDLIQSDSLDLYSFSLELLNSGDYVAEAYESLVQARQHFMHANQPQRIHTMGLLSKSRGILYILRAEQQRLDQLSKANATTKQQPRFSPLSEPAPSDQDPHT